MDVFIGNLPGTATLIELTAFLEGIELHTDCQCHRGYDPHGDRNYHFFVARTPSKEAGRALIAYLNGRCFEGRRVEAREYQCRGRSRQDWEGKERRINTL